MFILKVDSLRVSCLGKTLKIGNFSDIALLSEIFEIMHDDNLSKALHIRTAPWVELKVKAVLNI